jgi:hypothetical protein
LSELHALSKRNQTTDALGFLAEEKKQKEMSEAELRKIQEEEDEREIAELMALKKARAEQRQQDGSTSMG